MTAQTAELRVRFSKRSDGVVTLQCVRKDGSVTWQRHDKHGVFFSFHDLSHFAVETVLGFRQGFYGLLADGWDITDTTGKAPAAYFLRKLYSWSTLSIYCRRNDPAERHLCLPMTSIPTFNNL